MTDVNQPLLKNENKKEPIKKEDPTLINLISCNEDFYALTWITFRDKSWENKTIAGEPITFTSENKWSLIFGFFVFIAVVLSTVGVLLYESFLNDSYKDASWPIIILRITLVCFAQQKLKPEISQGVSLLRYTFLHDNEFSSPLFAKFVAFCQSFIAIVTFVAIFFFCCMADEALDLIMNFAGLAVISELDDWVGDQVMSEKLWTNGDKLYESLNKKDIDNRASLFTKMCLLGEDLEIVDNQNKALNSSIFYTVISYINSWIPYDLIPLLTLPCQYVLVHWQGKATSN